MAIRGAYASYKEIRLEIIMTRDTYCNGRVGRPTSGFAKPLGRTGHAWLKLAEGEPTMREWHKPTIEETESGMEVTSYLPAELDRA